MLLLHTLAYTYITFHSKHPSLRNQHNSGNRIKKHLSQENNAAGHSTQKHSCEVCTHLNKTALHGLPALRIIKRVVGVMTDKSGCIPPDSLLGALDGARKHRERRVGDGRSWSLLVQAVKALGMTCLVASQGLCKQVLKVIWWLLKGRRATRA